MHCTNCGQEVAAGARFCVGCGTALAAASPQVLAVAGPTAIAHQPRLPPLPPSPAVPATSGAQGRRQSGMRVYAEGKTPFLAWFFSFLLVGLGQFYNGDIKKGLLMLIGAVVGVFLTAGIGSFVIWVWSMIDAYRVASRSIPLWT